MEGATRRSSRCSATLGLFLRARLYARWARESKRSRAPHVDGFAEAEASARTGIAATDEIDNLWLEVWAHEDLATVLERAGRIDEAREALERALTIWERKGCLPCAQRLREQIASLGTTNEPASE